MHFFFKSPPFSLNDALGSISWLNFVEYRLQQASNQYFWMKDWIGITAFIILMVDKLSHSYFSPISSEIVVLLTIKFKDSKKYLLDWSKNLIPFRNWDLRYKFSYKNTLPLFVINLEIFKVTNLDKPLEGIFYIVLYFLHSLTPP